MREWGASTLAPDPAAVLRQAAEPEPADPVDVLRRWPWTAEEVAGWLFMRWGQLPPAWRPADLERLALVWNVVVAEVFGLHDLPVEMWWATLTAASTADDELLCNGFNGATADLLRKHYGEPANWPDFIAASSTAGGEAQHDA